MLDGESHRERQADSLQNASGRETHGPEWRAAKEWEKEQKRLAREGMTIPTASELLMARGDSCLAPVQRTMSRQLMWKRSWRRRTFSPAAAKRASMTLRKSLRREPMSFFPESRMRAGRTSPAGTTRICRLHGTGGSDFFEGFLCRRRCRLEAEALCRKARRAPCFPTERDAIKVFQQAERQALLMLLPLYFTGGRRSEIFRLTWSDVDIQKEKIRLTETNQAMAWNGCADSECARNWSRRSSGRRDARPCTVDNVFMQLQNDTFPGQPFTQRIHFMEILCRKAHVKPFGFHAIRHKSAAITFVSSGLNAAQVLMNIIGRPPRIAIRKARGCTRTREKRFRLWETAACRITQNSVFRK